MRKRSARWVSVLLVFALVALGSVSQLGGQVQAAELKGKIVVWAWSTAAAALKSIIPEFNKEYPGIKVEVQELPWEDVHKKLLTVLAAGTGAPDVVAIEGSLAKQYAGQGLMDLTAKLQPYLDKVNQCKLGEAEKDGKIYAVPWDTGPTVMYYRTDIFKKEGITKLPDTWDEFRALGKKLTHGRQYMISIDPGVAGDGATFTYVRPLLNQLGVDYFDKNGDVTLNTPEMKEVLQLLYDMTHKDKIALTDLEYRSPAWYAAMKNGMFATVIGASWMGGIIKSQAPEMAGKWGAFPLPAWEKGGTKVANMGGSVISIPAQSKNKELAWEFVKFALLTDEGQLAMYKTYDIFPSLETVYSDPYFDQADPYFSNQKMRRLFATYAPKINPYYYTKYYGEVDDIVQSVVYQILTGKKAMDAGLQELQAKAEKVRERYK